MGVCSTLIRLSKKDVKDSGVTKISIESNETFYSPKNSVNLETDGHFFELPNVFVLIKKVLRTSYAL